MAFRFPSEKVHARVLRGPGVSPVRELLVVACPRSGTRYFTRALRRLGMGVRHEGMSVHGSVSPFLAFEDFWYPGSHGGRRSHYQFERTWHLVRHPLRTIASLATPGSLSGEFLHWQEKHTKIPGDLEPALLRAALLWVAWVEACGALATWTVPIERLPELWPEILDRLSRSTERDILGPLRKDIGRKAVPRPIGWSDLDALDPSLGSRVRDLAHKFGYEEDIA